MILTFYDKSNKLPITFDTDNVLMITYNEDFSRAVVTNSERPIAFTIKLSDLLMPFVNDVLFDFVYVVASGSHYLININKVNYCKSNGTYTHVSFRDYNSLTLESTYPMFTIEKALSRRNENTKSEQVYHSSEGDC